MTPTTGPTVYEALRGAIAAVGGVDKDGFNTNQSFAFRSIEGTVAATRQALLDHQISLIPSFSFINSSDWDRGEGKSPLHRSELIGTFRVIGPSGDEFRGVRAGGAGVKIGPNGGARGSGGPRGEKAQIGERKEPPPAPFAARR